MGGRPQRRPVPWPKGADLKDQKGLTPFLGRYVQEFWKANPLDARAGGVLNQALKLMLAEAERKDPLPWPEGHDLDTKEHSDAFLIQYIKLIWQENALDPSTAMVLNAALRLYCDVKGWIPKAPLQIIQQQAQGIVNEEAVTRALQEVVRAMPDHLRREIWDLHEREQQAKIKPLPQTADSGSSQRGS